MIINYEGDFLYIKENTLWPTAAKRYSFYWESWVNSVIPKEHVVVYI